VIKDGTTTQFSAALKMTKNILLITIAVTDYPYMSSWTHIRNADETISLKTICQMRQSMSSKNQQI